jgi:hypothetical protein
MMERRDRVLKQIIAGMPEPFTAREISDNTKNYHWGLSSIECASIARAYGLIERVGYNSQQRALYRRKVID